MRACPVLSFTLVCVIAHTVTGCGAPERESEAAESLLEAATELLEGSCEELSDEEADKFTSVEWICTGDTVEIVRVGAHQSESDAATHAAQVQVDLFCDRQGGNPYALDLGVLLLEDATAFGSKDVLEHFEASLGGNIRSLDYPLPAHVDKSDLQPSVGCDPSFKIEDWEEYRRR